MCHYCSRHTRYFSIDSGNLYYVSGSPVHNLYNLMLDAKSMAPPFQALQCTVILRPVSVHSCKCFALCGFYRKDKLSKMFGRIFFSFSTFFLDKGLNKCLNSVNRLGKTGLWCSMCLVPAPPPPHEVLVRWFPIFVFTPQSCEIGCVGILKCMFSACLGRLIVVYCLLALTLNVLEEKCRQVTL